MKNTATRLHGDSALHCNLDTPRFSTAPGQIIFKTSFYAHRLGDTRSGRELDTGPDLKPVPRAPCPHNMPTPGCFCVPSRREGSRPAERCQREHVHDDRQLVYRRRLAALNDFTEDAPICHRIPQQNLTSLTLRKPQQINI